MMRGPTNGIKPMRIHHPLRFVSWSRRTHTPSDGSNVARTNNPLNKPKLAFPFIPVIASTTRSAPTNKQLNNWKNQYSFRRARPENIAYCFKPSIYQCMIASRMSCRQSSFRDGNVFSKIVAEAGAALTIFLGLRPRLFCSHREREAHRLPWYERTMYPM